MRTSSSGGADRSVARRRPGRGRCGRAGAREAVRALEPHTRVRGARAASRPGESYWASISWAKICAGSQIPFYWNLDTTGKLNSTQRKLVAIHEFGHIQGLAHVTRTCSQTPAVMVQGKNKWDCGWAGTAPWLDDRNGVHAEY